MKNHHFFAQVLLQTYIEHLRSKLEDKKEMNHHGKSVEVNTIGKITPVEYVKLPFAK